MSRQQRLLPPHLQVVPKPGKPAVDKPEESNQAQPPEGWLYGAEAIQAFLELPNSKMVYRIKEAGAPIGKLPGVGLAAQKSELEAWRRRHVPGLAS